MIMTISSKAQITSSEPENHPQYLKFQRLLDQYFEIINDEEERIRKFLELTEQSQKLEQMGIFPRRES